MRVRSIARSGWFGYVAALAAVAVISSFIGLLLGQVHIANISMLYLVAVLAIAVVYGSGPAIVASVVAFLAFDFFFVPPIDTFTVDDPSEWVALFNFLLTAIITGQLTAVVQRRANEAAQREREAALLYDIVRLMAQHDLHAASQAVAERLRTELGVSGVTIDLADGDLPGERATAGTIAASTGAPLRSSPADVLREGGPPSGRHRGEPGRWVRVVPPRVAGMTEQAPPTRTLLVPVRAQGRRVGTITLMAAPDTPAFSAVQTRLLSAVSAQLGLATERARLQREATEAEILRRTDELRSALLDAVSHDLRTPLASIIASAGSLRQSDVEWTEVERREFAEAIEEEAQRLNRIVGNLLDLSRVEAGSIRPDKGWYDLGAIIDDVLGRLRPLTAHHPIGVCLPDDLPPVLLDYVEIDQVLSNVIENAVKYAPSGTPIDVVVGHDADTVEIAVADRGPGIPAAALPRLFEPFFRGGEGPRPDGKRDPTDTIRGIPGMGVGLAVAKGLIEAHGGTIVAANRPGGGSSFTIRLPMTALTLPLSPPKWRGAGG